MNPALPQHAGCHSLKSLPVSCSWYLSLFADLNYVYHPSKGEGFEQKGQPYGASGQRGLDCPAALAKSSLNPWAQQELGHRILPRLQVLVSVLQLDSHV